MEKIQKLIAKNKIGQAFEEIFDILVDEEFYNRIYELQRRFEANKKGFRENHKTRADFEVEESLIASNFLNLIGDITEYQSNKLESKTAVDEDSIIFELPPNIIPMKFSAFRENAYIKIEESVNDFFDLILRNHLDAESLLGRRIPNFIVVEGVPGIGKTIFCKSLVNSYRLKKKKSLYYSLRAIKSTDRFINKPLDYIAEKTGKNINEYDLLVLDGLNDLRRITEDSIIKITENIIDELDTIPNLKVVLSTRLHLIDKVIYPKNTLFLKLENLDSQQRNDLFQMIKKEPGDEYPWNSKVLSELFVSLLDTPANLQFLSSMSLSQIEDDPTIFDRLYKYVISRNWEKEGTEGNIKNVNSLQIKRYFDLIASVIWKHNYGSVTINDLIKDEYLKQEIENLSGGKDNEFRLRELLSVFYFAEIYVGEFNQTSTIEFSPKDLLFFFLANYLYGELKIRAQTLTDLTDDEGNLKEVLEKAQPTLELVWTIFVGPDFNRIVIERLIYLAQSDTDKREMSNKYQNILPVFIKYQMLFKHKLSEEFIKPLDHALEGFYWFWSFLRALFGNDQSFVKESIVHDFVQLIRFSLSGRSKTLPVEELDRNNGARYLDLSYQLLQEANLDEILMERVNLEYSIINESSCQYSRFKFVRAKGIRAVGVNFNSSTFEEVDLDGASINSSSFEEAKFLNIKSAQNIKGKDVNMDKALVSGINFSNSDFSNGQFRAADFSFSQLKGVNFSSSGLLEEALTDLTDVNFSNATFDLQTNFNGAILDGACFDFVKEISKNELATLLAAAKSLERVRLHRADFSSVTFDSEISLRAADLRNARLIGTRFIGTKLEAVNFSGSSLSIETSFQGANLMGANLSNLSGLNDEDLAVVLQSAETLFSVVGLNDNVEKIIHANGMGYLFQDPEISTEGYEED